MIADVLVPGLKKAENGDYELDLSSSRLTSIAFVTKFLSNFKFLTVLSLNNNELNDDSIKEFE